MQLFKLKWQLFPWATTRLWVKMDLKWMRQSSLLSKKRASKRMLQLQMKLQLLINKIRQPKTNYLKIKQLMIQSLKIRHLKIHNLKINRLKTRKQKRKRLRKKNQKRIKQIKALKLISKNKRTLLKIKHKPMIPHSLDMKEKKSIWLMLMNGDKSMKTTEKK